IEVIAGAGAGSGGGLALPGAAADNKFGSERRVEAYLSDGAQVEALQGIVEIHAIDDASLFSFTLSGAGSGNLAFALGLARNTIEGTTSSFVDGATVGAPFVDLLGLSTPDIVAFNLVGSGAGGAAGAFAATENRISSNVEAHIRNGAEVLGTNASGQTVGAIAVKAVDDALIQALAISGSGAGGQAGVVSLSLNELSGKVRAGVEGLDVRVEAADVTISAGATDLDQIPSVAPTQGVPAVVVPTPQARIETL
ncbi:MAG: hypothetical protein GWO24_06030, partial [Akkermansiaceae bacterium]|nr:hypothetical protein [Akkermansiaceae bacterium]